MITENITMYKCEICGASLRTKEICEEHEIECKKEKEERNSYKARVKELTDNQHIFHAKDVDDLERCVDYCFSPHMYSCEYEDFKYPCFVLITTTSEPEPYEDYYTDVTNIKLLDKYVEDIENIKQELKKK